MPKIKIDGKEYEVEAGQNLLHTCLSLGLDLPYFCWHPEMGSVGACRQCAVTQYANEEDERGRLVMGCMTPVTDGGIYSIGDQSAQDFRSAVIEDLMTNHPHDCPVCEEGGECHLQDMTEMSGHTVRYYEGSKRTHVNQDLGPFINHEMNRCITCYRCVRYYREYAGGTDLAALGRNYQVYFGRQQDGALESEFAGNLVEVCPTGVFTDKTFSGHYARKWDLQTAPSVCNHCAVGCNTTPGERYGALRRVVNRYHGDINGYFLCDRGRFGYEYVNSELRLKRVLGAAEKDLLATTATKDTKVFPEISPQKGVQKLAELLSPDSARQVIGIGSPRATLENNFALRQFVGDENFYLGVSPRAASLMEGCKSLHASPDTRSPTIPDIEAADAVFILGEDVSNTAPRVALALRQSVRNAVLDKARKLKIPTWQDAAVRQLDDGERSPLFIAATEPTRLADVVSGLLVAAPQDLARFGFAVAHTIDPSAPAVTGLSQPQQRAAVQVAEWLMSARNPLLVTGSGCQSEDIIEASRNITRALAKHRAAPVNTCIVQPEANSLGLSLLQPETPTAHQQHLMQVAQLVEENQEAGLGTCLVILENDLFTRIDPHIAERLIRGAKTVVVLDVLLTGTTQRADLIFPASAVVESQGTFVSNEGRAQHFYPVYEGSDYIQESWRWLADAALYFCQHNTEFPPHIEAMANWEHTADVDAALQNAVPGLAGISEIPPDRNFRISGLKVARQTHRYSGRTAMYANLCVAEKKQPVDDDSPLSYSMEGAHSEAPPALASSSWAPGWNSNQSINKFQDEVGGHLRGGESGLRLTLEEAGSDSGWKTEIPNAFAADPEQLLIVPRYCVFGSDELSNEAPGVRELSARAKLLVSSLDADRLDIRNHDRVGLQIRDQDLELDAELCADLPAGMVCLPMGIPGLPHIDLDISAYAGLRLVQRAATAPVSRNPSPDIAPETGGQQ
ncbi:NADH-quinone oxidoreductase subunit NuoG [Biformimicrobium ophioploci]|uniref:NADH-quinone oxidoreductase n=1 Tax=Biformimicrobium ophioploci TaxID=3036711 RepID=A0ABQ6LX68_9GAMM|nr:NADH-quinone oxidoreductase subunit NuoG [Microbulbifer sp. NKW57]GMG86683.1 NADH-quinone oxidoreductase subunit NuoG [Microbulbifer sp. NKW57]